MIVGTTAAGVETLRPVCDSRGDVRLFSGVDAASALSKRATLAAGTVVRFVKKTVVGVVGDPVKSLIAKHKSFKVEAFNSATNSTALAAKIAAAAALGWDTAVGTPEGDEYGDLVARKVSIDEWKLVNDTQLAAMAAALTTAGISPITYLPL